MKPKIADATRKSRAAVPTGKVKPRKSISIGMLGDELSFGSRKKPSSVPPPAKTSLVPKRIAKVNRISDEDQESAGNQLALEVSDKPRKPKISKTELEDLRSIIGDNIDGIQTLLEEGNFESATNSMHKVLLQTLVDVIPYAENAVRKSGGQKGVYQINSLASMILETLSSARAQSDRGRLAEHILERSVQPAFKQLAESLVREFMALTSDIQTARTQDLIDSSIKEARNRLATSVQNTYEQISAGLVKSMAG